MMKNIPKPSGVIDALNMRATIEEKESIKYFAKLKESSVSEFVRITVLSRIMDELGAETYEEALCTFKTDPDQNLLEGES